MDGPADGGHDSKERHDSDSDSDGRHDGDAGHEARGSSDPADVSASELDDTEDRDELRRRYYGLMQELRVLLPGVQILVAFLLTAPFANRFRNLDQTGRMLYGVALCAGTASIVAFATPTVIHRVGDRRARSARLVWSVQLCRFGLACFGLALVAALMVVARFVFSPVTSVVVGAAVVATILVAWIALPLIVGGGSEGGD
jgi:hypothetical protein